MYDAPGVISMYVFTYLMCLCVCVCVCVRVRVHVCVHVRVCVYIYAWIYKQLKHFDMPPHLVVIEGIEAAGVGVCRPAGFIRASVGVTPALEQSTPPSGGQLESPPEKMISSPLSDRDVVCRQKIHAA